MNVLCRKKIFVSLLYNFLGLMTLHRDFLVLAEHVDTPLTGSFQDCTESFTPLADAKKELESSQYYHPDDSDIVTISCTNIHYRVPQSSIRRIKDNKNKKESIIIGVLSGAHGEGPLKRNSIRSTWAYRKQNIFFIVAGPWDEIKHEYNRFGDLFWIEKDEIYITENSVLTFKTESFVAAMYNTFMKDEQNDVVSYLFKTDDDSYVDLIKLYRALLVEPAKYDHEFNYWGKCNKGGWKPHRNESNKWFISKKSKFIFASKLFLLNKFN